MIRGAGIGIQALPFIGCPMGNVGSIPTPGANYLCLEIA